MIIRTRAHIYIYIKSADNLPAGQQLYRWSAEEFVWEVINFFHNVGKSDRKLLSQEHKGGLLTGIGRTCSHMKDNINIYSFLETVQTVTTHLSTC